MVEQTPVANPRDPERSIALAPRAQTEPARAELACTERLRSLDAEIQALHRQLHTLLPLTSIFQQGGPNDDAENMFRPIIDRIFAAAFSRGASSPNGAPSYALECKDAVCELTIVTANGVSTERVQEALARDTELLRRISKISFGRSRSASEELTNTPVREDKIYWRAIDPDAGEVGMRPPQ